MFLEPLQMIMNLHNSGLVVRVQCQKESKTELVQNFLFEKNSELVQNFFEQSQILFGPFRKLDSQKISGLPKTANNKKIFFLSAFDLFLVYSSTHSSQPTQTIIMPPMLNVLVYEKCRHYPDSEYVSLKMTRELEKVFENNPSLPSVSLLKLVKDIVSEHLPDKTIIRAQILVDDEYMDVGT
jgi:hypothetical protein